MTPPTSLPQPIYKPLCVFRNSVGLLCISESLSAGWGEGEGEEWRDEGLQEAKKRSTDGFCCEATSFLSNQ